MGGRSKDYTRICSRCGTRWYLPKAWAKEKPPSRLDLGISRLGSFGEAATLGGGGSAWGSRATHQQLRRDRALANQRCPECGSSDFTQYKPGKAPGEGSSGGPGSRDVPPRSRLGGSPGTSAEARERRRQFKAATKQRRQAEREATKAQRHAEEGRRRADRKAAKAQRHAEEGRRRADRKAARAQRQVEVQRRRKAKRDEIGAASTGMWWAFGLGLGGLVCPFGPLSGVAYWQAIRTRRALSQQGLRGSPAPLRVAAVAAALGLIVSTWVAIALIDTALGADAEDASVWAAFAVVGSSLFVGLGAVAMWVRCRRPEDVA
jgi:predicted  nucleic acid-binding Zn-ribbon protein